MPDDHVAWRAGDDTWVEAGGAAWVVVVDPWGIVA